MADEKLQAYFKFDDADLEANRQGKFSEKQKARLAEIDVKDRRSRKILGIFLIALAGALALTAIFWVHDQTFLSVWLPLGLFGGLIGVLLLRFIPTKSKKFKLRRMQGVVKYSRHIHRDRHVPVIGYWIIHVGNSWFDVGENVPSVLKEGAEYIVYTYAFQAYTYILSAEPVAASDSPAETAARQPIQ